jgi:hypothetical protein
MVWILDEIVNKILGDKSAKKPAESKPESKSTPKKIEQPKPVKSGSLDEIAKPTETLKLTEGKSKEKPAQAKAPVNNSRSIIQAAPKAPTSALAVEDPNKGRANLEEAANNPATRAMLDEILSRDVQPEDISDNSPERLNIESANRILGDDPQLGNENNKVDQYAKRDRTDLSPLFGYLSSVSDGKFKDLATSYKPPESADQVVEKMMGMRQVTQAQRDQSENRQAQNAVDAYEAKVRPITTAHQALISALNTGAKADSTLVKTLLDGISRANSTDANNSQKYLSNFDNNTTKTEIANASFTNRAREFSAKMRTTGRGKRVDPDITEIIATRMAPLFYPKGQVHPDRKQWGSRETKIMGNLNLMVDAYAHRLGLYNIESNDQEVVEGRRRAAEAIISAWDPATRTFNDPDVEAVVREIHGETRRGSK